MGLPLKVVKKNRKKELEPYLLFIGDWTEERYFDEAPETGFVEFADGEVIMHAPVTIRHQRLVGFLTFLLTGFVQKYNLGVVLNGPAGVRLRPDLDYEPDVFFIPADQLPQLEKTYFAGSPALIVEVISPATRNYDLQIKAANYRKDNVSEYWVVNPDKKILHLHTLPSNPLDTYHVEQHQDGRLESKILSGFWIDVAWLWQENLPSELSCLEQILS